MRIPIREIKVNPGRREVNLENVRELAGSIRDLGLLHPIIIDKQYVLIAGLHRLEAAKMLDWTEIECTVSSLEGLKAELAEIDENVVRSDLSALEFGELLLRRKEIYEALHPTVKHGGDRKSEEIKAKKIRFDSVKSFVQDTAEKMGVTPRTVEKQIQTAKNLTPEAKAMIRESDTKIGKEAALKLSRLEPEQQKEAVEMLSAGEVRSVEQYNSLKALSKKQELEPPQKTGVEPAADSPTVHSDDTDRSEVPYQLPGKKFNSFEESVADLKNPDKDCSCTPDIFLAEYCDFISKFIRDIQWYSTPQYEAVFPALTQIQIEYLHTQTKALCQAAVELLRQVERRNSA